MARKKLTLGEKIALAAAGNQDDDFPEDIEYGNITNIKPVVSIIKLGNFVQVYNVYF